MGGDAVGDHDRVGGHLDCGQLYQMSVLLLVRLVPYNLPKFAIILF